MRCRGSEAAKLKFDGFNFSWNRRNNPGMLRVSANTGRLHVRRSKKGTPSVHSIQGDEIRALRRLQREQQLGLHVFMSERGGPMTPKASTY